MRRMLLIPLLCFTLLPAAAQQSSQHLVAPSIRTNVSLVLVPVTVTDRRGAMVNGLDRSNFTVLEDKVPQPIVAFTAQDAPSSVGLIFDSSGSMRDRLETAKSAVRAFTDGANPEDEAFLLTVSSRPEIQSGFTSDLGALADTLQFATASGSTALVDTVYAGLQRMRSAAQARRALLIISDGMDNNSRYSKSELMQLALEADVQIYTIAIDGRVRTRKAIELQEENRGLAFMEDLAEKTGGLHFAINSWEQAGRVVGAALQALRNQYVIGYQPAETDQPGKWHRIRVKLNVANTNVSARNGYYSR
jgi:Ca-activated chloride channel family protein